MPSKVEIINLALVMLDVDTISDIDQDVRAARLAKAIWDTVRRETLRASDWKFAIKRVALAASTDAVVFEYSTAFNLPSDYLRLVKIDGVFDYGDWTVEGLKIYANGSGPLNIAYVADIVETGYFDASFSSALAAHLAFYLAPSLDAASKQGDMWKIYQEKLADARFFTSSEAALDVLPTVENLASRL